MRTLPPENLLFVKTEALEQNSSEARGRGLGAGPGPRSAFLSLGPSVLASAQAAPPRRRRSSRPSRSGSG